MKYYFLALGTLIFVCVGCVTDGQQVFEREEVFHAPPAARLQRPGPMVDGPGPGVMPMMAPPSAAAGAAVQGAGMPPKKTQIRFVGPEGMHIGWNIADGYAENQLVTPARFNFPQGATYRLKFTQIPGRQMVLYPTLQVYPSHPTTDAYLSHNSVPVAVTDEDLDQIATNNFVTKVIYLPDPEFQELAIAGVETLVSTRLDPGVDPVAEADRRGTIMVVLRIGNKDLQMPGDPPPAGGAAQPKNAGADGPVQQISYRQVDGNEGDFVPPAPVGRVPGGFSDVPSPMIAGSAGTPGKPAYNPVAGAPGAPSWGMPMTSTPIGLPGPPHLPLGGPAGLQSHTVRNLSDNELPKPVDHMLVDVEHEPGYSIPKPVKHIQYSEKHPVYAPGEAAYPAGTAPPSGHVRKPQFHHSP